MEESNSPLNGPLYNPLFNVLALLAVGTIGIIATTQNTATPDPAKSELVINWVPMIIVGVNILLYILVYRVRREKAHLITIGGIIGLVYYLGQAWLAA